MSTGAQLIDSETEAMPAVQCPLQPCLEPTSILKAFFSTGLRILQEIEEHISTGECHHPSLKDIVFHGSLDGTTPMLLACHYGDLDCVKRLVDTWIVDVNAPAVYCLSILKIDKYCKKSRDIRSATPLFVAAFNGHVGIVRYLLEKGADVSSKTCSDSNIYYDALTPLHGALCEPGTKSDKLADVASVVLLLLQSGADPSALPSDGSPIWMGSIMYGACPTIALINHGMVLDQKNSAGETILHCWAGLDNYHHRITENDLLTVLQLLVEKGADLMARDHNNFTPILTASNSSNFTALDFLLKRGEIHRMEKIDAMEMAAVHNEVLLQYDYDEDPDPKNPDYQRVFGYFYRSLKFRKKEDRKIPLILRSGRAGEWTTKAELDRVYSSDYHLQRALAKLRICSARSLGALSLCNDFFFSQYLDRLMMDEPQTLQELSDVLWAILKTISEAIRRFDSRDVNNKLSEFLIRCADFFIWMLSELESYGCLLESTFNENFNTETFEILMEVLAATIPFDSNERNVTKHVENLLDLVTRLIKLPEFLTHGKNETMKINLRKLVLQDNRDSQGRTLLHLVLVNGWLTLEDTEVMSIIRLLLQCGANANAGDESGDSPLHLLVHKRWECGRRANKVIDYVGHLFLENGVHLDKVNKKGKTAAQMWIRRMNKRDLPEWLRDEKVPKLSCLSARIIRSQKISYDKKLPPILCSLVDMH